MSFLKLKVKFLTFSQIFQMILTLQVPSCWLSGNGKFCLMIDNTKAILIGQNLATILLDIDLLDKNFDKFIIGLHFFLISLMIAKF